MAGASGAVPKFWALTKELEFSKGTNILRINRVPRMKYTYILTVYINICRGVYNLHYIYEKSFFTR